MASKQLLVGFDYRQVLDEACTSIRELQHQLDISEDSSRLKAERLFEMDKINQNQTSTIVSLERTERKLRREVESLNTSIEQLEQQTKTQNDEIHRLSVAEKKSDNNIDDLHCTLKKDRDEITRLNEMVEQLEQQNKNQTGEIRRLTILEKKNNNTINVFEHNMGEAEAEICKLNEMVEQQAVSIQRQNDQIVQLKKTHAGCSSEQAKIIEDLLMQVKIAEASAELDAGNQQMKIKVLQDRISEQNTTNLQEQLSQAQEQLSQAQEQIAELQVSAVTLETSVDKLKIENTNLQSLLKTTDKNCNDSSIIIRQLRECHNDDIQTQKAQSALIKLLVDHIGKIDNGIVADLCKFINQQLI